MITVATTRKKMMINVRIQKREKERKKDRNKSQVANAKKR